MNFNYFLNNIFSVSNFDLPSIDSHLKMAPLERFQLLAEAKNRYNKAKSAAVMMLIYPKNDIAHLVLIVRNSYPGVHSSQIAFPGGKVEILDVDLKQTALRETYEEIGVSSEEIKIIRAFSQIYIPPSNFLVYPYLGISEVELKFKLQKEEVAGIIELPLTSLLDDSIVVNKIIDTSYAKSIEVPAFEIDGHIVWGATAMMLSELKDVLKMVF